MSETVKVDIDALTMGDLLDFEEFVGRDLFEVLPTTPKEAEGWRPSAKVLVALVWLTKRSENPDYTIEDARKVRVSALELAAADPPEAAG